jgi:N-terminal domain of anti-restriction factor ArdC
VLGVGERQAAALEQQAAEEADRGGLVALWLSLEQYEADRERVVELDVGELGGGRADEQRVARGERSSQPREWVALGRDANRCSHGGQAGLAPPVRGARPELRTLAGCARGAGRPRSGRGPEPEEARWHDDAHHRRRRSARRAASRIASGSSGALGELLTSAGWKRWLRTRAVLRGYSLHNTLLIAHQCAGRGIEPTYVAGFRAWLKLGRCVRKGERGIAIWAPIRVKPRAQDRECDEREAERRLRFRLAYVFDVSQTEPLEGVEPAPLTPPGGEVGGDSHAHLVAPLEQLAREVGYEVVWVAELPGQARGLCRRELRRIELLERLEPNARAAVLVHKLCHALVGEGGELAGFPYGLEEIVVESATYVACASVGLATDVESVPYIAGWAGDDNPAAVVREAAEAIETLARVIEDAIAPGTDDGQAT